MNSDQPSASAGLTPAGKAVRQLRWILLALVTLLVFEGLLRKLSPGKVGILIFLFKDVVIVFMGLQVAMRHRLSPAISFLSLGYMVTCVFFLPCILNTAGHDPLLAIFGAKEYLLYPIVGISVFVAFENATVPEVVSFCRYIAFLMIPAGLIAMLQTQLSPNHWLNLSVGGDSLEDFSSAGHLRVSSTFSFVAQFCGFLNMEMYMIFIALQGWGKMKFTWKMIYLLPIPMVVICSYLTGSRGAVVGNTMVLVIAAALSVMRFEIGKIIRMAFIGFSIVLVIAIFQYFYPSLMATYTVREKGHAFGVSNEVQERVYNAFFGWMSDTNKVPFFGNGLGIMSNGSDAISTYSRSFRLQGWTETDFATTLFEGGPYLIFIWYGFRFYMIYQTTRRFLFGVNQVLFLPASLCQAYVILIGMTGTLGMQPPTAIWWWLAIGLSTTLWWKSVHPIGDSNEPPPPSRVAATAPRVIRGRSAYAEHLHGKS